MQLKNIDFFFVFFFSRRGGANWGVGELEHLILNFESLVSCREKFEVELKELEKELSLIQRRGAPPLIPP